MIKPAVASDSQLKAHMQQELSQGAHGFSLPAITGVFKNYRARAYRATSNQTAIPDSTYTKIQFNGESFDPNANFDSTTAYGYTAPKAGYYRISAQAELSPVAADKVVLLRIFVNSSFKAYAEKYQAVNTSWIQLQVSDEIYLAAGDVVYAYVWHNAGSATPAVTYGEWATFMVVSFVSE